VLRKADHRQYNDQQLRESVQAVSVLPIAPVFSDQGQKDRDGQNAAQANGAFTRTAWHEALSE
jgi:hypothetical protein